MLTALGEGMDGRGCIDRLDRAEDAGVLAHVERNDDKGVGV